MSIIAKYCQHLPNFIAKFHFFPQLHPFLKPHDWHMICPCPWPGLSTTDHWIIRKAKVTKESHCQDQEHVLNIYSYIYIYMYYIWYKILYIYIFIQIRNDSCISPTCKYTIPSTPFHYLLARGSCGVINHLSRESPRLELWTTSRGGENPVIPPMAWMYPPPIFDPSHCRDNAEQRHADCGRIIKRWTKNRRVEAILWPQ